MLQLSYVFYIRCTPDALWAALTHPDQTRRYLRGYAVESTWETGAPIVYRMLDGRTAVEGVIVDIDAPRRLAMSWQYTHAPTLGNDPGSRVEWNIEAAGANCRLNLVHDSFEYPTKTYNEMGQAWPAFLSSLKTLLETGSPLDIPGIS